MASGGSKTWSIFSLIAAVGAAAMAKKAADTTWKVTTGKKPPENPADPDVEIWEAVSWAVVSGVAVGLARMLAQRKAANYYARSTGHLPADLRKDGK
ncbi:DUF4235 domain-containing protein [Nocardioides sp. zg-DK7169]|uniref:DUF4235 domain-containing protein n=1 Tax=Nocardioides sp. zg-DK7169 TaxID=2736600 RepID=UPI0015532592|nr:DUF4235 domain-containing protein [Nocardioides sp. zg-DK7169]NPC95243.1 DUF4235 domain-containing protein [Nocardioides sp. zg-DK7169]